jgi:sugar-specific transcriptional regulator TrmB
MEQTSIKKETSIDWLMAQLYKKGFIKEIDGNEPIILMNQAKEMEKEKDNKYAEMLEMLKEVVTTYDNERLKQSITMARVIDRAEQLIKEATTI